MLRVDLKLHPETNESIVLMSAPEFGEDVMLKPIGMGDASLLFYSPIHGETFPKYADGWHLLDPHEWNEEFGGLGTYAELAVAVGNTIKKGA